jgi:hypothetical protein
LAFDVSVLFDFDAANFRQLKFGTQREATLRVGETVVAIAAFESRKTRFLSTLHTSEECFVGFVQTAQRILQHLAEYARHVWANLFDVWQLINLVEYSNGCAVLPSLDALLQASIV